MNRLLIFLVLWPGLVDRAAAQAMDTLRLQPPRVLDPLMVTTERANETLAGSVASVTRLDRADLLRFPRATLADLLRAVPGFTVVDFDGLGFDPQIMVRGFYGGGEAEYVIVMVDGVALNRFETGVVAWDALPPIASIESIEIVRGGGSALYGDAAIGGVIHVRTVKSATSLRMTGGLSGGAFGTWRADGEVTVPHGVAGIRIAGAGDRTGGWRDHAGRVAVRGRAVVPLVQRDGAGLWLTAAGHGRDFDEPGPLLESEVEANRRSSNALFRFDHTSDYDGSAHLAGESGRGTRRVSGSAGVDLRSIAAVRTLVLAPGFGDTKEREAESLRATLGIQVDEVGPLSVDDRVTAGVDAAFGSLDSKYFLPGDGASSRWERGSLDTHGSSSRAGGAVFARYSWRTGRLRISAGARVDVLQDHFEPKAPAEGSENHSATRSAFSPGAGVNVRWLGRGGEESNATGNLYLAVSRSFKAPTLDQLYDQRNIPVPFPPFQLQTSNPELSSQHGTNLEAGLYHRVALRSMDAHFVLSGYQIAMSDELDFDVNTFRYVNIGRSRHRGIEAGVRAEGIYAAFYSTYTLQAAVSRSGPNAGKQLKAIPRHTMSFGATARPLRGGGRGSVEIGMLVTGSWGIYLDDGNTVALPGHTRVDLRLAVQPAASGWGAGLSLFAEVRNVLGRRFSSSGFLDPNGSGEAFLFPAAGRVIEVGVRKVR